MASTPEQLLSLLEDTANLLAKTQANLKKCPKTRLTKGYIETRIKSIEEYWTTFRSAHQELVKIVPTSKRQDVPYFVNEDYFIQEDLYTCLLADLNDLLYTLNKSSVTTEQTESGKSNCSFHSGKEVQVKLPRIQLPTFSGTYDEWPAYQDMFTSLVHDNENISKVQKLHYLKSSLSGEALLFLKDVKTLEANYDQAWNMLKARFGNKRIIVNAIFKRLFFQKKKTAPTANNIKSLLDTTTQCLNALNNFGLTTSSWDPLIVFLVVQKFDPETHRDWEKYAYRDESEELPTWDALNKYLRATFRALEQTQMPPTKDKPIPKEKEYAVHLSTENTNQPAKPKKCTMCNKDHTLSHCEEFAKLTPTERCEYVKQNHLCYNCLAPGHSARICRLRMSCKLCHKRHHTLTHQSMLRTLPKPSDNLPQEQGEDFTQSAENEVKLSSHVTAYGSTALLATALVPVREYESGQCTVLRALIDHGSQASLISERAAQLLRVKREPSNGTISGVGSTKTNVKHAAEIELLSRQDTNFKLKIKTCILSTRLTAQLPAQTISTNNWPHLQGLVLADPCFYQPGRVDLLLGVDVCAQIMKSEVIKGSPGSPCAQNTSLGWILFGTVESKLPRDELMVMHLDLDLNDTLKRMWEQESYDERVPTVEERKCEEIHKSTTTRDDERRNIVTLPKKSEVLLSKQGDMKTMVIDRLYQLEQRFTKIPKLKKDYNTVMKDYEQHYIEEVPTQELTNISVYLPHHAVVRAFEDSDRRITRALGSHSNMGKDLYHYSQNLPAVSKMITKRTILPDLERLFDQLGWLVPSVLLITQRLWLRGITWDEEVNKVTETKWKTIRESCHMYLPDIEVDRRLHTTASNMNKVTIHGFCDASSRAYAAVKIPITGVKTRVAPTKPQSLPRLELSEAVLLAGLLKQIKKAMNITNYQIYAWTDATIVISWLFGNPARWNTYVRNRIVKTLDNIGSHKWYHVKTSENPANIDSRGQSLLAMKEKILRWKGLEWLREGEIQYGRPKATICNLERKEILQINPKLEPKKGIDLKFENYSTLQELLKVFVYCKRFLKKRKLENKDLPLDTKELHDALTPCIKLVPRDSYEEEIENLKGKQQDKRKSNIKYLNPYLDDDGILRVGGRLRHSNLNSDTKYPVILNCNNNVTSLVVADAHMKTLHGGSQVMLCFSWNKFWILKVKPLIK